MATEDVKSAEEAREYQDIIAYKQKHMKIIRDEKTMEILKDPNHYPIIRMLRKGPMTVREIEKRYCEEAEESNSCEPKSDKTIYRYLKTLEAADLVVPAGQRVVLGKTATETLFTRSTRVFLMHGQSPAWWKTAKGKKLAKRIGKVLGHVLDKTPSIPCLQEVISKMETAVETLREELADTADEEVLELITAGDWHELDKVLMNVGRFGVLLQRPDLIEELSKCFKAKESSK